jgi:adenylate cyclase
MEYGGQYYVHLSLATLLMAVKPEQMILWIGKAGTESLAIDGAEIPLDDKGRFLIPFRFGRGTFRHIPASDILNGTTGSHEIKDRIVLIGASAPGLHDIHAAPTDPVMAGAEVQANIIDAVLQGDFLVRPKGASYYEFIAIILIGILSTICFALCRVVINLTLFLLFSAAAIITAILLFRNGMYLSPLYPLLVYASNFSVLSILNFWRNEKRLKKKSMQHLATHDAILEAIANITETRDAKTGDHIRRTRSYVKVLAEQIRHIPAFAAIINDEYIKNLCMSAPLHDMGKVGVADSILLKPGLLTPEEFEAMKLHTQYGRNVLDAVQNKLMDDPFLRLAREMVVSHHERWDGKGYPDGLKGEDIPLSGRIMAIADVYDALTSARPYRDKMSHETAVDIIVAGRGSQFDPQLVDAFAGIQAVFRTIANDLDDTICRLQ